MMLFKQLITKKYQKFIEHQMNNRFFPEEFYQAHSLANTILQKKHENQNIINQAWKKLHENKKTIQQIKKGKKETDKEHKKRIAQHHKHHTRQHQITLHKTILEDMKTINEFIQQHKHIQIKEEPPQLSTHKKGIIGIVRPGYTYEK
jgi:hypothetical protein